MENWIFLGIGIFIGICLGIFVVGLCQAASERHNNIK